MSEFIAYSRAEKIIKDLLKQAKFEANSRRKIDMEERKDIFEDDFKDIIYSLICQQFKNDTKELLVKMLDCTQNPLKRIVNEISLIYRESPKRIIVNKNESEQEKDQELLDKIVEEGHLDLIMPSVNQYSNLIDRKSVV